MPLREHTDSSRRFHRQLKEIRHKIDSLPEGQRVYFHSLADQAEQHHISMEADCGRIRDAVDDMRLGEAAVRFDIWATAESIKRLFASRNPG